MVGGRARNGGAAHGTRWWEGEAASRGHATVGTERGSRSYVCKRQGTARRMRKEAMAPSYGKFEGGLGLGGE